MEKKAVIDLGKLDLVLKRESNKIVGIICKRFEISDNKEDIKKQVKELLYEHGRNLHDTITYLCMGDDSFYLEFNNRKENKNDKTC